MMRREVMRREVMRRAVMPFATRRPHGRCTPRATRAWSLLMASLTLPGLPRPATSQAPPDDRRTAVASSVRGSVLEHESGEPLPGATVSLTSAREDDVRLGQRVSDEEGGFLFREVPPGTYVVAVVRAGFRAYRDTLVVVPDSEIRFAVELSPSPIPLEAVVVVVSRAPAMTGFEERRRRAHGTFITRDEIEALNPTLVTELLRTVPGAQFWPRRFGGLELRMRGRCRPTVWVNGARAISASAREIGIDQILSPFEVEAIEVYRGAGSVPVQFGPEPCGAVIVWTRRPAPEPGRGSSWRKIFVAAGIALAILAFH